MVTVEDSNLGSWHYDSGVPEGMTVLTQHGYRARAVLGQKQHLEENFSSGPLRLLLWKEHGNDPHLLILRYPPDDFEGAAVMFVGLPYSWPGSASMPQMACCVEPAMNL
jgi:hypothetical protein